MGVLAAVMFAARVVRATTLGNQMQLVAILGSGLLLLVVLEMVRRRRLMERYALLWLLSALVLIGLAAWRNGLVHVSHALGIYSPPNALFVVAFGFVLLLLLHFSAAVSRLSDQTKVLAQRLALLEERVRRSEHPAVDEAPVDQELEAARAGDDPRLARVSSD